MDIRNRRDIRQAAQRALATAPGAPKQVALIYAGVSCLLALASTLVSFMLNNQIADTGGLSNLGLRSILSTIQYVLPLVQMLVMMCMGLGYHAAMLNVARRRAAVPGTLAEGFYRFGPLIRSVLLQSCVYFLVIIGSLYLSSWIFTVLPASAGFYEVMEPILSSMTVMDTTLILDDATLAAATAQLMPMMWIFAVVCVVAIVPVAYQYRMVSFCLLDSPRPGAFAALRDSRAMMRRNRFAMFRLDLGFWWYYLLQVLITVVCYGDMLLPMAGITLPWSETASYFLFYILSLILQLVVYCFFMNRVTVTYAMAYEALRPREQEDNRPVSM